MKYGAHMVRLFLCVIAVSGACPALCAEWRPLALDDVEMLLANTVSSRRIAVLVREHGVDFNLPEAEADRLRSLGLDNSAVKAIRESYRGGKADGDVLRARPSPEETTVPDDNVAAAHEGEVKEEAVLEATPPKTRTGPKHHRASPHTGTLYIESEPVGARIFERGTYQGRTPLEIRLGEGLHVLVFVRENYEAEAVPVVVMRGVNPPISVKFIPK